MGTLSNTNLWIVIIAMAVGFSLVLLWNALAQDSRTLVHTQPLSCDGYLEYHDKNATPQDGAEVILLFKDGEKQPRATVEFDAGKEGTFKSARVTIPGLPVKTYTDPGDVPHPCEIVTAVGAERT